ncbi:MAG TPA: class II aldolase [Desulfobulbus sp.]|nr:class II aldolase [Desulfobulbus sp.]
MTAQSKRRALIETARTMNRVGLNQGTSGNLSLRLDEEFLITPSALAYDRCTTADLVRLDMNGEVTGGTRKPSSEWRIHRDIYRQRPEARAILHAHPPWCTTLACLQRDIPPFHYMVAVAGGSSIACAPYALFGSRQLSDNVLAALDEGRCACLLAHHGMVCFADGPDQVLALAIEVENLARVYVQALQVGEVPLLSGQEMEEVMERFAEYRNR